MIPNQTVSSKDAAGNANGKVASMVIRPGAGILLSLFGYNAGAQQFIHLHDAAAQPANGAVPLHRFAIPAADNFSVIIPRTGINFSTGIVACVSTTDDTTTLGAKDVAMLATILA
ncbi:MAG TPA: hypothetical protein VHA37_04525 [Candidatus Saccharimonadales bacterium]|nr:hypothetical protein [Candidatus Saccharimonadales bacterium]